MNRTLVMCAQQKDRDELGRLNGENNVVFTDFTGSVFEKLLVGLEQWLPGHYYPDVYLEYVRGLCDKYGINSLLNTSDYPGSLFTSILAQERGFAAPSLSSILACQHKYYSRLLQKKYVPDATPECALVKHGEYDQVKKMQFPLFVKPVKSYLSALAKKIDSYDELVAYLSHAQIPEQFLLPFNWALKNYSELACDGSYFIAEQFLKGRQVTLEGYMLDHRVGILGIVDSYFHEGTLSFERFVYPSDLPDSVQQRMIECATRIMKGVGFDHNLFNIEFMYDPDTDDIKIIEINPRMSSQFSDLFAMVNGVSSYELLYDLIQGKQPIVKKEGAFNVAASLVRREWKDQRILKAPTQQDLERARERFPELRYYPWMGQGEKLSDVMQDGTSYVYCWIHLGARDAQELEEKYDEAKQLLPYEFGPV